MKQALLAAALTVLGAMTSAAQNSLSDAEAAAGWQLLFDGSTTDGWRNYQTDSVSTGWQVRDGNLTRVDRAGDLISREQFADFELQMEWKVDPGGNSGLFIRAGETAPYIFMTAPEIQILDDAGHPDGRSPLTSAGSNFGLHPVPRGIVKPAGEWNHLRVRVDGNQVTQWLNGVQVVAYEMGSLDWQARVGDSKFDDWPDYGTLPKGHIGLQDHGDTVAFRNIKIRRLNHE